METPTPGQIRAAGRRWKAAADRERQLADELRTLVVAALADGMRPGDAAELSGWVPSQVRKLARAAGLPPAPRGRPPRA